jgi:hypothetical protein
VIGLFLTLIRAVAWGFGSALGRDLERKIW